LARALRFNGKGAEFISFKMPRRYGSTKDITAVPEIDPLTYEEWEAADYTKGDVYQDFESQVRLISQKNNK